jgi:hypothetical protein
LALKLLATSLQSRKSLNELTTSKTFCLEFKTRGNFMNFIQKTLLATAVVVSSLAAQAQISLGQPAYAGTGCPAGSASATLTDDGSILSILFDSFTVEAGKTTGRRIDRKNCALRIPVNVGQGYQVALLAFDYKGFAAIPYGASGQLNNSYNYIGGNTLRFNKRFQQGAMGNYSSKDEMISTTLTWSPCGRQIMLATNTDINVVANSSMQQTMLSVDSIDVTAGLLYKIQWRRCQ